MSIAPSRVEEIQNLVIHQLKQHWLKVDEYSIKKYVPLALNEMEENIKACNIPRLYNNGVIIFSEYHSVTWMIFLYRLSHLLGKIGGVNECADMVYYLNKIMHGIDWYHQIELPIHFLAEHPLGSVLGRAKYGDYFFVYQGTTVGGNRKDGILCYPQIGNNVIMYANSSIIGDSKIGDNVIISANTTIMNEIVPDNCLVFGKSPNLIIRKKGIDYIGKMNSHIWKN